MLFCMHASSFVSLSIVKQAIVLTIITGITCELWICPCKLTPTYLGHEREDRNSSHNRIYVFTDRSSFHSLTQRSCEGSRPCWRIQVVYWAVAVGPSPTQLQNEVSFAEARVQSQNLPTQPCLKTHSPSLFTPLPPPLSDHTAPSFLVPSFSSVSL